MTVAAAFAEALVLMVGSYKKQTAQRRNYKVDRLVYGVASKVGKENADESDAHKGENTFSAMFQISGNKAGCANSKHNKGEELIADAMVDLVQTDQRQDHQSNRNYDAIDQANDWSDYGKDFKSGFETTQAFGAVLQSFSPPGTCC